MGREGSVPVMVPGGHRSWYMWSSHHGMLSRLQHHILNGSMERTAWWGEKSSTECSVLSRSMRQMTSSSSLATWPQASCYRKGTKMIIQASSHLKVMTVDPHGSQEAGSPFCEFKFTQNTVSIFSGITLVHPKCPLASALREIQIIQQP